MIKTLNIAALGLIAVGPVALAISGFQAAGGLLLISLIVVLLGINVSPDRFEELTLGPLRAKLREKIKEADQLSEQLKSAIKLTLTLGVTAGMRSGRFAHQGGKLHKQIFEHVHEVARSAGLSQTDVDVVLDDFFKYVEIDMRSIIVGNHTFYDLDSEKLRKEISDEKTLPAQRLKLMKGLADREIADPSELDEWLKDYDQLIGHKRLRRPDVWWSHHDRRHDGFVIQPKPRQK